jgi:hypothetical protein
VQVTSNAQSDDPRARLSVLFLDPTSSFSVKDLEDIRRAFRLLILPLAFFVCFLFLAKTGCRAPECFPYFDLGQPPHVCGPV